MPRHAGPPVRWTSPAARAPSAILPIVLVALSLLQALARPGTAANQDVPVPGGNEIVAEGTSTIPFDPIAWRVVGDTARPPAEAQLLERALGFAIAAGGALVIAEEGVGSETTVEQGEAAFIPEAAIQRHASPGDVPVSYLRIGLVLPADASFTAGGELVYPGESFDAPDGERRLVLYRNDFGTDDEARLADTGYPTLVLVAAGAVAVATATGESVTIEEGQALALAGDLTLTPAGQPAALVYAATIEEVVTPRPTATADTGQVTVLVRGCPAGAPPADAAIEEYASTCIEEVPASTFVVNAGGRTLTQAAEDDVVPAQRVAVWEDVPAGPITIASVPVVGFQRVAVFCRTGDEQLTPVQNLGLTLEPGQEILCWFFYRSGSGTGGGDSDDDGAPPADGRITIQMRRCPAGIAEDDLPAAKGRCVVDFGALDLTLVGEAIDGSLTDDDWVPALAGQAWADLPLGEYQIVFAPPGAATILTETDGDALGESEVDTAKLYPVTLSAGNPDVLLLAFVFTA